MDEVFALVASCLVLVRAVGMTRREADDWLTVAAGEVGHYPPDILAEACREARRNATHHGKIVPIIVKHADERLAARQRVASLRDSGGQQVLQLVHERWKPTRAELDEIRAAVITDDQESK